MPPKGPRQIKSRSGCQTCKAKRLKCDETVPSCVNCVSRGLECPGYARQIRWSAKHEVFAVAPQPTQSSTRNRVPGPQAAQRRSQSPAAASFASRQVGENQLNRSEITETPTETQECGQPSDPRPTSSNDVVEMVRTTPPITPRHVRNSRALLKRYYRLSHPTVNRDPVNPDFALVEYYFRHTCGIWSIYDSVKNPYRTSVARLYPSYAPVYYAISSMAAAHIANTMPEMAQTAVRMQRQANYHLEQEIMRVNVGHADTKRVLFTLFMVGLSGCWHDSSDLGLPLIKTARNLVTRELWRPTASIDLDSVHDDSSRFLEESLIYWEMLLSFVSPEDDDLDPLDLVVDDDEDEITYGPQEPSASSSRKLLPHPWTGVTPEITAILAEVGRLIRQQSQARKLPDEDSPVRAILQLDQAKKLETRVLAFRPPQAEDIMDSGDAGLTPHHLTTMAMAYKHTALLELYRCFPTLLQDRLRSSGVGTTSTTTIHIQATATTFSANTPDLSFSDPLIPDLGEDMHPFDMTFAEDTDATNFSGGSNDKINSTINVASTPAPAAPPSPATSSAPARSFSLNSLSKHIIHLLMSIPPSSGISFLQLLPLMAAGAELRYPDLSPDLNADLNNLGGGQDEEGLAQIAEIISLRGLVTERLLELSRRLPAKPISVMLLVLREVWCRLDLGVAQGDAFWVDIMRERGWVTLMG